MAYHQEVKTGFQLDLSTKGRCFLCLIPTNLMSSNIEQLIKIKQEKTESTNQDNDRQEPDASSSSYFSFSSSPPTSICLQNLCKNLKINMGSVAHEYIKLPLLVQKIELSCKENSEMKVYLCKRCGEITEKFSNLFQELLRIPKEIDQCLEKIQKRISNAEKNPELTRSYQELMQKDMSSLLMSGFTGEMRKKILNKCSETRFDQQLYLMRPNGNIESLTESSSELDVTPILVNENEPSTSTAAASQYPSHSNQQRDQEDSTSNSDDDDDDDVEEHEDIVISLANNNSPVLEKVRASSSRKYPPLPVIVKVNGNGNRLPGAGGKRKKIYKCSVCHESFSKIVDVKYHKQRSHGGITTTTTTAPPPRLQVGSSSIRKRAAFKTSSGRKVQKSAKMANYKNKNTTPKNRKGKTSNPVNQQRNQLEPRKGSGRRSENQMKLHKCPFNSCGREFSSNDLFLRHYQSTHINGQKAANQFQNTFSKDYIYPFDKTTGKFKCRVASCQSQFTFTTSARKHYRTVHVGQPYAMRSKDDHAAVYKKKQRMEGITRKEKKQ